MLTLRHLVPLLLASAAFAQITPGNLVVTRVGDGAAALTSASTAVFLEEYTPLGVLVQTIAMPTAASGSNLPVTNSGTATSEGFLSQSADGRYLISVGYGTAPGTASVPGTTALTVNRVVARIALDGSIDSSTALTDAYSTGNIRSAVSLDGSQFWTSGNASAANGPSARYVANVGDTTSTTLSSGLNNVRVVNVFEGQLYCSSAAGTFQGVSAVGTGLPTTTGQTVTLLNGFPTTTGPSSYDFFFADASTLYVADDRTNGNGGIQKWTLVAGTWTLQYTLAVSATTGCRGLDGRVDAGVVTLFATTSNNLLVSVVDTGAASVFTTIVTGVANTALRGVQFVRTPPSVVHSGTGCAASFGIPTVGTAGGAPVTGNASFAITAGNSGVPGIALFLLHAGPVSPIGIPVPGTLPCVELYFVPDVILAALTDANGDASTPLPIPATAALGGALIAAQVAALDFTLTVDIPVGTSDALQVTVGN